MLADLVLAATRTICFVGSRRGVELIQQVHPRPARRPRPPRPRRRDRSLPRRLHPPAAARDRGPPRRRRAARGRRHERARARDRHRRARRGDLRRLPGHRRQPPADVGAGGPPPRRPGGLHRRHRRARPVLLPPPDRVPDPAGRGGDPRPPQRADPVRPPPRRRLRGAARLARATTRSSAPGWRERADALLAHGYLRKGRAGLLAVRGSGYPAGGVSLRSASADAVTVVDAESGELLGTVEAERAFSTVHPGAVYLHLGRSYEVRELDLELRRAIVEPFSGDWYTQAAPGDRRLHRADRGEARGRSASSSTSGSSRSASR